MTVHQRLQEQILRAWNSVAAAVVDMGSVQAQAEMNMVGVQYAHRGVGRETMQGSRRTTYRTFQLSTIYAHCSLVGLQLDS